ncbi:MAG TPA: adenylate/guanylate cyclase domain-containing protein [Gammaproteobacteria bacterium]|nr:adenylate/guanylate cyclase domain-containing protein [Gammaproteobacteria bacterium]
MTDAAREMAAVMFTDVRGYSSLAQRDEALALRLLDLKRTLADPLIAEHHGRLVKSIGDALMVEFRSALAAVECATELQKRLHEHNQSVPEGQRLTIRIGVHLGDVVRKDGDLLGDTVNIAARVEPLAAPGGIAVTQAVYDQIRGKFPQPLLPLGGHKLKGIDGEVPLYAVSLPWLSAGGRTVSSIASPGFVARLKQHHMFRVASVYGTVAWVLILVANQVFPDIGLSREAVRYLIAALALGFPLALTAGWMFVPPSREDPATFGRWKRLRFRLGAVVSIFVIAFVTVSGAYLWRLSTHFTPAAVEAVGTTSIVVLPFDKLGLVPDEALAGVKTGIEGELGSLGTVKIIAAPVDAAGETPQALGRSTSATLLIRGSIHRPAPNADFTVSAELVSTSDGESLDKLTKEYSPRVPPADIAQEFASRVTGSVRFIGLFPDVLATGFDTTRSPEALSLLRRALLARRYTGARGPAELCRDALRVDPDFAQAHAYLAYFEAWSFDTDRGDLKGMADEIAAADRLAPGLPEARLAQAGYEFWAKQDPDAALKTIQSLGDSLPNNTDLYSLRGVILRTTGHPQQSLEAFLHAARLDPYLGYPIVNVGMLEYRLRRYEDAIRVLDTIVDRFPSWPQARFWRAQVSLGYRGDIKDLEDVIDGGSSRYWSSTDAPTVASARLELEHLEGQHAKVIAGLMSYPDECLQGTGWNSITDRVLCQDSYTAESQRLLGDDAGARRTAALHIDEVSREIGADKDKVDARLGVIRLALLEAFGGQPDDAVKTIAPLRAPLAQPPDRWTEFEAETSSDLAVVLAWSGQRRDAIALLSKSLEAPFGANAAIVAKDPVWRPLYSEPAFKALLASHGQALAYTK